MRIAVIEDNDAQREQLLRWVNVWQTEQNFSGLVKGFASADQYLFASAEEVYDLLLIDIRMDGMTGIELARKLRERDADTLLAFLTADREFVFDGYKVDALDYLLKPINEADLRKLLEKAQRELGKQKPVWLIKSDGGVVELKVDDVSHIEAKNHQTILSTHHDSYASWETLTAWKERIEREGFEDRFVSPHRSFIVHLHWIRRIDRNTVRMANGDEIPLARGRFAEISQAWLAFRRADIA